MYKFIILTFLFLGWGFYEMSGGAEFEPVAQADPEPAPPAPAATNAAAVIKAKVAPSNDAARAEPGNTGSGNTGPSNKGPGNKGPGNNAEIIRASAPAETPPPTAEPARERRMFAVVETAKAEALTAPRPAAETAVSEPAASDIDDAEYRMVRGNLVNMRDGPGRNHTVIDRLGRGQRVEVLQDPGDGWVKLRVAETRQTGWMADFLLIAAR